MTSINYTSPWKKFILTHETTCRNCPEGFGSSSGDFGNTYNTTINYNGGGFMSGFRTGIAGALGGIFGGLLFGSCGGGSNCSQNMGNCSIWNYSGFNMNQLTNPNLALWQTSQNWNNSCWG